MPYSGSHLVQLVTRGFHRPFGTDLEGIFPKAGDNKDVDVKDFLTGHLTIRQKEINTLALHTGITYRLRQTHYDLEEMHTGFLIHLSQVSAMLLGNNHELAAIDRPDIHEGDDNIILIDDAGGSTAGESNRNES